MFSGNSNYLVPELGEMGAESCRFSECRKAAAEKEGREKDAAQDAPVRVLVGVAIIGISELDIITQEFKAEFQLDQTWHDPEFCGWMKENRDKFAQDWQKQMFERAWHPNLFMVNQVEIISREGWWNVSEDDHITLKLRMKGIFSERFELRNFPFDVQNLRLEFQSSWSNDLVQFVDTLGDREASNILNKRRFILEEWALGEQVLIKTMTSDKEESRQGATYGRFQVYVYVARQWKFYCWNIFSILFLITSLSHFVGVVDESEFTDRLPNLFTMLLVSVAFKLAIANQLPAISYQTMIDNYAYYSILWIAILIVEVSAVQAFEVKEDSHFFMATGCAWGLYNVKFAATAYFARQNSLQLRKRGLGDTNQDDSDEEAEE